MYPIVFLRQASDKQYIGFAIRFILIAGFLFTLVNWAPSRFVENINCVTARSTGWMMHLIGLSPSVQGSVISTGGFRVNIIAECSAVFVAILFAAFVLSYPTSAVQKARGLALGLPGLFVINNLRIVFIVLIGIYHRRFFDYAHVYLGQILMILVVLLFVIHWLRAVVGMNNCDTPVGFVGRFFGYSSLLFLLWLPIAEGYIYTHLYLVKWSLQPFGFNYPLPEKLRLFPDTFNSFPLVAYAAMVLATRSITGFGKLKYLMIGSFTMLFAFYLFRLADVLFSFFHVQSAFFPALALLVVVQWGLPFFLWLVLIHKDLFSYRDLLTVCPICGRETRGIFDHLRAKHPGQAFGWQLADGRLVKPPTR